MLLEEEERNGQERRPLGAEGRTKRSLLRASMQLHQQNNYIQRQVETLVVYRRTQ